MKTTRNLAALAVASSIGFGLFPTLFDQVVETDAGEILRHLSVVYLDDGQGGLTKTIRFTGVNVQIVNGLGATYGEPLNFNNPMTNGVGNLIVGYNEPSTNYADDRTGSHNIVGGIYNNYSSFGGVVFGVENEVTGAYACSLGGIFNDVAGERSVAVGGNGNRIRPDADSSVTVAGVGNTIEATARRAAAVAGSTCTVEGDRAAILGGSHSLAQGIDSTVTGGQNNSASGLCSSVTGGRENQTQGDYSSVVGGRRNVASGVSSVVGGGRDRTAPGPADFVAGSLFEDN